MYFKWLLQIGASRRSLVSCVSWNASVTQTRQQKEAAYWIDLRLGISFHLYLHSLLESEGELTLRDVTWRDVFLLVEIQWFLFFVVITASNIIPVAYTPGFAFHNRGLCCDIIDERRGVMYKEPKFKMKYWVSKHRCTLCYHSLHSSHIKWEIWKLKSP